MRLFKDLIRRVIANLISASEGLLIRSFIDKLEGASAARNDMQMDSWLACLVAKGVEIHKRGALGITVYLAEQEKAVESFFGINKRRLQLVKTTF